jgi:histidyl-tRNA synthetase
MADRVRPRTLKGFRDLLPSAAVAREHLVDVARSVFRRYGFGPIETPALEYTDILLGKGSDEADRQLYRFEDAGGRDVALRFDLTVPLARYVAEHEHELGMPFKRYHVGTVWRGENTQRGRYREFLQADFDTIGTESVVADVETAAVIDELFSSLGFERFTIKVNNRKVLNGLLERLDVARPSTTVLRALDKLPKIGAQAVSAELVDVAGLTAGQAAEILTFAEMAGSTGDVLAGLERLVASSATGRSGVDELVRFFDGAAAGGVASVELDVAIARGLDYYTGTVFETYLDDLPDIGSCCSGGRYDDLAGVYTKSRLPGVGASLGVDRLLAAIAELGLLDSAAAVSPVLVAMFDADRGSDHIAVAAELRRAGLSVELYPDARKLSAQLRYADQRGHRVAVIIGPDEWETATGQVKDLVTGASTRVARAALAGECLRILSGGPAPT